MSLSIEFKYSMRMLLKKPLFTSLTILIVAIGLGLTVYTFSLLNGLVFKPLYLNGEKQIVAIEAQFDHNHLSRRAADPYHINLAAKQLGIFENHGFFTEGTTFIGGNSSQYSALFTAKKMNASYTSVNIFDMTGIQPLHGRGFIQDDFVDGAEPVVVLSYNVWQQYFNADPKVINQQVALDAMPGRIIGVMPEGFSFPDKAQIWQPLNERIVNPVEATFSSYLAFARLAEGVTIKEAQAGLDTINQQIASSIKEDFNFRIPDDGRYLNVLPYKQASITQYYNIFIALLIVVFLILLLACINVSNLLLARVNERIKEVAIRLALGIPRKKLMVQMLWESVFICTIGGLLALLFAAYGIELTNNMFNQAFAINHEKPFWWTLTIDSQAVVILVFSIIAMVLITGLFPAYKALKSDFNAVIRDGTRGALGKKAANVGKALVISEIVLSCVVLVMATVLLSTGYFASKADYGVETTSRLTAQLQLPPEKYPVRRDTEHDYQDRINRSQVFYRIKSAIDAMPNINASAMMTQLPGTGEGTSFFEIEGRAAAIYNENPYSNNELIASDSWRALGMKVIQGRDFDHRDAENGALSIIINQSIASAFFPDGDAVGKRVRRAGRNGQRGDWFTIVGVVSDTFHGSTMSSSSASYNSYHSMDNIGPMRQYIAVHYTGDQRTATEALMQAIASVDSDVGIYHIQTYDNLIQQPMKLLLSVSKIFLFCGIVAVILAASGIYAMASNSILTRTQEIGVRRAIGAPDKKIMLMFLKQAATQLFIGLALGITLSIVLTDYMSNTIVINPESYGIALVGIPLLITFMVIIATYIPSRSILRLEPSDALHYD
ncbi:FtsX-like permease family protein [Thalassotalea hakodatensis]|uniref:FtsX-like permease family protein n=1 Tax=Thalassotalea hakodatensis TaxID=3030492 RepID=UPI0025744323|nr:FtsX-like permease family protein [Thalassotalea hakodatensis]